ncbi:MAG: hypothetical protein ACKVT0_22065, partial [Planctomycetaceae bacterium]
RRNRKVRQLHHAHKQRLRQRWKIERTNAWLHRYGRLAIRKDRRADIFGLTHKWWAHKVNLKTHNTTISSG